MLNDWNPETTSLLSTLRARGFVIIGGHNGEDAVAKPESFAGLGGEKAFLDELLACDECILHVRRNAKKESPKNPGKMVYRTYSLYLVLGNSPGELVSDYGIPADIDDANALELATTEHSNLWEDKAQPMIRAKDKYPSHYPNA